MTTVPCGERVFSVGTTEYRWEDVVLAAILRGDWAAPRRAAREGLACEQRCEEDDDWPDADRLETAMNEFRYARDLVTARDTEAWLRLWGLTAEDWVGYVRRSVLRRQWAGELDEIVARHPVDDDEADACVWSEAVCSGAIVDLAREQAGRAAVAVTVRDDAGAPDDPSDGLRVEIPDGGVPGLISASWRARLGELVRVEDRFQRFCGEAITPAAIDGEIRAHRLDWVRVDGRYLSFAEEGAAREALLCLREDGLDLDEVARQAGVDLREASWYLDDVTAAVRSELLVAGKGDVVGPLGSGDDGFLVLHVIDKVMPSGTDEDLRTRARERAMRRLVEQEVSARVRWDARWSLATGG